MKIAAVIVSRKGSKRIANKANKEILGKSLLERKILQLKKVKSLNRIYLGTNDLNLKKLCIKHNIEFVRREEKYCNEKSTSPNDMVKNMLTFVEEEIILWAHITNPFINEKNYNEALKIFIKNKKNDSLFSVTKLKNHFWSHKKKPINHNPFGKKHIIAKKLKPIFSQNGGIFKRYKKNMIKDGRFVGNKPIIYEMNEINGWDLDYPWQLTLARALVKFKYAK